MERIRYISIGSMGSSSGRMRESAQQQSADFTDVDCSALFVETENVKIVIIQDDIRVTYKLLRAPGERSERRSLCTYGSSRQSKLTILSPAYLQSNDSFFGWLTPAWKDVWIEIRRWKPGDRSVKEQNERFVESPVEG